MSQQLTLTTPITFPAPPSTLNYHIVRLVLEREPSPRVLIVVQDNNGVQISHLYEGTDASTILSALNTANMSIKSLQQRALERLAADGVLGAGTVTGTVD